MRRRTLPALAAALLGLAAAATAAPAPAHADQDGGGTRIGGAVSSTLALDLAQAGDTVRATVTTTEPGTRLSVAPAGGRAGLSAAAASGPYAPIDPAFGVTLVAWDDVLAGRATTLRLKSSTPKPSTVFITLSAATP
jgi:ABC-type phosphate transport system substrate-binding protein